MDKKNNKKHFHEKQVNMANTRIGMAKKRLNGILTILTVIMVIGSLCIPSFVSVANEIEQAKQEKTDLEKKKEETELRIAELEKEKDDILKYIEELDMELNQLSDEIDTLNGEIDDANASLVTAKEELEVARAIEEEQYSIMKKRIQYMYENGETGYLELLLQSESMTDVLNQVEYMSKITQYDNSLLEKYTKLKQNVVDKELALEDKITKLNVLKEELNFEQETVVQLADDKKEELIKYEASISESVSLSEEYSSKLIEQEDVIEQLLEAERIRIEEEQRVEAARKAEEARIAKEEQKRKEDEERRRLADEKASTESNDPAENSSEKDPEPDVDTDTGNTESTFNGTFIWPVPSSSRITSTFGYRDQPTAGASTYHKGIDIGASSGSQIVASASGTVVTAAYNVSAGNYIMVSHGDGLYTVYMHCSKLLVSVGNQVNQGEVIALVGSTGVSTGPHLHFGVSKNGTYVNPQDYVSR